MAVTMNRRNAKRLKVMIAAAVTTGVLGAMPASADCLAAEVYYQRPGQTKQYVVPYTCVPTPFPHAVNVGSDPVGEPSIIMVGGDVWVPLP